MTLNDNPTYYDLLEIPPDASPQEIRAAYLRAKTAYKKDSVALYTLISEEETEELLNRVEEAYQVLSNPEKRREYDRRYGLLSIEETPVPPRGNSFHDNIVSIDRVPPMDAGSDSDLLVAPSTDFTAADRPPMPATAYGSLARAVSPAYARTAQAQYQNQVQSQSAATSMVAEEIMREVAVETDWRGPFLRRVREARRISLEELSAHTKISRTYITAIEEENYNRLPAPVYLRGFLTQICKALKLPHETVVALYLDRYTQGRADRVR